VDVPKEVCAVEQVNPRQVLRPIVKKWCSKDPVLVAVMRAQLGKTRKEDNKEEESTTLSTNPGTE
jgi:hypothetical protein